MGAVLFVSDLLHILKADFFTDLTQKKTTLVFGSPTRVLGTEVKQGESVIFFIYEDKPVNNHINEKVSSRALH